MKWRALVALCAIAGATSCSTLIGIEEIHPGDGPGEAGGASGADASTDRTTGTGGAGGGTGGTSGAAGALPDVIADRLGDAPAPGMDASSDTRSDTSADVQSLDVDDATPDTSPPDGGPADTVLVDAADVTNGGDAQDGNGSSDTGGSDVQLDVGDARAPDGGTTDAPLVDASTDTGTTITVTGRIVDYWKHTIPSVPVTIGGVSTTTDASGQFTVSNVTKPYDVFFTISTIQNNTPAKYGWLYKGLTRTDPTLQVGQGLPPRTASQFDIHVSNVDFTNLPATQTVHASFGGVDGTFESDLDGADSALLQAGWFGPTTTSMNGHALHWQRQTSTTLDLPTSYLAYDAKTASLTDALTSSVSFDLAPSTVTSGALTGTVTSSVGAGQRENDVFVRFTDNAVIQIAQDTTQPTSFSYLVPTLLQGSITVAATTGSWYNPPYAVAHKDGLSAGQAVAMTVPDAPLLAAPAAGTTGVNQSTLFRWGGTAKVFLWAISFTNEYKGFFVVTTENQGRIATMPDGPAITPNAPYSWWVETSGSYQNVDEATSISGCLDSFRLGTLSGALQGDGAFASSEELAFTSAP